MSEEKPERPEKKRRRFWKKKRWWLLFMLVAGLVWLDGPGWKWIARLAADHYLPELGYDVDFELEGRLSSGGIGITTLQLDSDTTVQVAGLDGLKVDYLLSRVVKGEVASVELEGLHVEVDLDAAPPKEEEEEASEPLDPAQLLTDLRQRLAPMNVKLRDVSAVIRKGDELVFSIEETSILNDPGSDAFVLELGAMKLPGDRELSAQTARIDWKPDRLVLDRLKLLEEVAVTSLEAEIGDTFRFRTRLEVADARFDAETNLDEATVRLSKGTLSAAEVRRVAEIELPLEGVVSRLEIEAAELAGGLETLTAEATLGVDDFDFDGWTADDLQLDAGLASDGSASVTLGGQALGSPVKLEARASLSRGDSLLPTTASARLESPRIAPALTFVRDRFTPAEDPVPLPESSLTLDTSTTFDEGVPDDVRAELRLVSSENAPPLSLDARWQDQNTATAQLSIPGLRLDGRFVTEGLTYDGEASLEEFRPESLAPWLSPFGIELPPGITASLTWKGEGDLPEDEAETASHEGKLELTSAEWVRDEESAPLKAFARGSYDWPTSLRLDSLNVQQGAQKIETELELADRVLALTRLGWSDGDDVLATGTARIPVPEDIADWKALLRETRPIDADFETPELPLTKLHPFLPETVRFPDASRAKVEIALTGTPADPELVAQVRGTSLGLVSQPNIPAASLELDMVGKNQTLKVDGGVITEDYPPAKISLVTNWDPDHWAEDPATVKEAKLDAELSIDDLNLASLATFVPDARTLEGILNADVQVGGTVGAPEPLAHVTLDGGTFRAGDPDLPRVADGTVRVTATPATVDIETVSAEISGGTVNLTGTIDLNEWQPANLDLKLNADSIPAMRNASMIVRLSADLALRGEWETARLTGGVQVVDSLFFKDIELLPIGEPMTSVAEPLLPAIDAPPPAELTSKIPEPFVDWGLDVSLKTKAPFLIRGNLASGEVYLDARVGGTVGDPRPSGEAQLREIAAQLPFSTLEIESGKVRVRPDHPFDPVLDLRGTSRIRPYDVTIYIYGPISDPKIQPTANPPLPETEVMTLIAAGTTTEGLEDPSAATARATQLLIEEARRGRIGAVRVLRPVFKVLDKVEFQVGEADPYTSKKYNSVSFDLDDNWLLSAGISDEGNARTKVTYLFRFK